MIDLIAYFVGKFVLVILALMAFGIVLNKILDIAESIARYMGYKNV